MDTIDFTPTCLELTRLLAGVRDDQLESPTPCPDWAVRDLLGHVAGLTWAFTVAARKETPPSPPPSPDRPPALPDGWREQTGAALRTLAEAWRDPSAYEGRAQAGPVEMDAGEAALVALDEVTVHAWDVAVATGQTYRPDPVAVDACARFAKSFEVPEGVDRGPFGPPVAVPGDASALDRLLGLTGRDPQWQP